MYSSGSTNSRPISSTATYTCDSGYTLERGSTTRTCGSDGMWSGSAPVCQRKLSSINFVFVCIYSHAVICSDLPPLPNGAISYNGGSTDNRPINTIATHSCNTGYTHTGDSVRLCQNDRTWSGSTPTCQGEDNQNSPATEYSISLLTVFCGPPPSITNGSPGQPTSTMIGLHL